MSSAAPTPPSLRPVVLTGPSGSGKSSIKDRLTAQYPGVFGFSVSHTTRASRGGEQHGVEYYFISGDDFARLADAGSFIEHASFGGRRYGTSALAVDEIAERGQVPLLDIEMEGVKQVRAHRRFAGRARFLFLAPPSAEVLEQRLRGRGTDDEDSIRKRLDTATREMEFQRAEKEELEADGRLGGWDSLFVVNDDLDTCYEECRRWIMEEGKPES